MDIYVVISTIVAEMSIICHNISRCRGREYSLNILLAVVTVAVYVYMNIAVIVVVTIFVLDEMNVIVISFNAVNTLFYELYKHY